MKDFLECGGGQSFNSVARLGCHRCEPAGLADQNMAKMLLLCALALTSEDFLGVTVKLPA